MATPPVDTESNLAVLPRFLRLIQFLTTLVVFSLTVYLTAMSRRYLTDVACILLICLTSSHLFFQGLDIMNQFFGDSVPESPMYIFSLTGMILFAIAGISLIYYVTSYMSFWAILMAMVFCFAISLLYAIEVIAVLLYWKKKYSSWKKCHPLAMEAELMEPTMRTLFTKACEFPSSDANICKCAITTSVSGQGLLDPTLDTASQHETRKINFARRRQYVDSPCSVPALSIQAVGQVQTDTGGTSPGEAQTVKAQMKESIMQTRSNGQFHESANTCQESKMISQQYLATGPCLPRQLAQSTILCPPYQMPCSGVCPAPVVIVRGAMSGSCCGSCNCCDHPEKPAQLHHVNRMQDKSYERPQHSSLQRTATSIIVDSDIDRTSGDQEPDEKDAEKIIFQEVRLYVYREIQSSKERANSGQNLGRITKRDNSGANEAGKSEMAGAMSEKRQQKYEKDYSSCELPTTAVPKIHSSKIIKIEDSSKALTIQDHTFPTPKSTSHTRSYSIHSEESMEKRGQQIDDINPQTSSGNASNSELSRRTTVARRENTLVIPEHKSRSADTPSNTIVRQSKKSRSSLDEEPGQVYEKLMTMLKYKVDEEIEKRLSGEKSSLDNERDTSSSYRDSSLLSSHRVPKMSKRTKPLYRESLTSDPRTSSEKSEGTEPEKPRKSSDLHEEPLRVLRKSGKIFRSISPTVHLQVPEPSKSKEPSPYTSIEPRGTTASSITPEYSSSKQRQTIQSTEEVSDLHASHGGSRETIIYKGTKGSGLQYVSESSKAPSTSIKSIPESRLTSRLASRGITSDSSSNLKNAESSSQSTEDDPLLSPYLSKRAPITKQSEEVKIPTSLSYTVGSQSEQTSEDQNSSGTRQLKKLSHLKSQPSSLFPRNKSMSNERFFTPVAPTEATNEASFYAIRETPRDSSHRNVDIDIGTQMEYETYSNRETRENLEISGRTIPSELSVVMESLSETNETQQTDSHRHRCHHQSASSAASYAVDNGKDVTRACGEYEGDHKRCCHRRSQMQALEIPSPEMNIQVACGWGCPGPCFHRQLCFPKSHQRQSLHDLKRCQYLCRKSKQASKRKNNETVNICYLS